MENGSMKMQRHVGQMVCGKFYFLLIGFVMNTLMSSNAGAADHIKITREILLESGTAVKLRAIAQTREGGYVIVGTKGKSWATRVDSEGKVQWRHEARVTERGGGEYTGAAVLPDDSTILCGYQSVPTEAPGKISGLLTHIDKAGQVISERLIEPNDGRHYGLTRLNACVAIGDEVVLIGETYFPVTLVPSAWIVTLDAKGSIKQEKFLPEPRGNIESIRVMPNNEIVLSAISWAAESSPTYTARLITRITANGDVKAQAILPNSVMQAVPTFLDASIRLLPRNSHKADFSVLDGNLKGVGQTKGSVEVIISKRAFYLPDHSLVLFGEQEYHGNSVTASVAWVSPDLSKKSVLIIEPALASTAIVDAVPTGVPGEFATIRTVSPMSEMGRNDTRLGVVLAFVQIK
jgi:hypothetical protein